jgi:hypothetical protein
MCASPRFIYSSHFRLPFYLFGIISTRPGRLQLRTPDVAALFPLGYEVAFKPPEQQNESFLLPFPIRLWVITTSTHFGLAGPGDPSIIIYPVLVL